MTEKSIQPGSVASSCIHPQFSVFAGRFPKQSAVVHGDHVISYKGLDRESDRLATELQADENLSGNRVAVFMPPGIAFMTAAMGILKTGAAYVPLDINDPAERVRKMIHRINPAQVITLPDLVHRLSPELEIPVKILNTEQYTLDHALLTGYVKNLEQISGEVIDECARELAISRFPEPHMNHRVTDGSSDHKDPGPEPVFESESTPVPPVSRTQPAAKAILNKDRADLTEDPSPEPAKPFRLTYLLIIAVAVLISVAAAGLFFL
jgi:acyl-CoA synthetase (AMP-forming)/AMP-acid ligase II